MRGPPRTAGERVVWAAAYAASWVQLRALEHKHRQGRSDSTIAGDAADEAWGALYQLRQIARGDGDFAEDARAIIQEEP